MRNHTLKRRLSALALGGVAALILAGCSGASEAAPVETRDLGTPVAGQVPSGVFDGVTLTYAASGGIFQDGQRDAAWDPFAKISGATFL